MKKIGWIYLLLTLVYTNLSNGQGIIIDHTCTDLTQVPDTWINQVKSNRKVHYAHTSHGSQITTGLERLENTNSLYGVSIGTSSLPNQTNSLCIFDGQMGDDYVYPDMYWETESGRDMTRDVLDNNSSINVSLWSWCTQLDWCDASYVQSYLYAVAQLQSEYTGVTFIYMTGNAQAWSGSHYTPDDYSGYNRYLRNEQIRQYCRENNKVLFDFADIDAWYDNEQATGTYDGNTFPHEHPHYNIDEAGHTSYENCENKAKAFWWMMARLSGWEGTTSVLSEPSLPTEFRLLQNHPNPFNPKTLISFQIEKDTHIRITIHDMLGRETALLLDNHKTAGLHSVSWNGLDHDGRGTPAGIYVCRVAVGQNIKSIKMVKLE